MMHIAYPNAYDGQFCACVRYRSLPLDQAPGPPYLPARPNTRTSTLTDIHQATLHLIPNWLQRSQGTDVYEKPDLPGIWQGDSLGLAYLLARIRCARPLVLETLEGGGDVWCTGVIQVLGDGKPVLQDVDGGPFRAKLEKFVAQSPDRFFLVPAANIWPEISQVCREHNVRVLSLPAFREALQAAIATGLWQDKVVIPIQKTELPLLVDLLFERDSWEDPIAGRQHSFEFGRVLQKTWQISLDHLSSVLNPEEYDESAQLILETNTDMQPKKFSEALFVSPKEIRFLEDFFGSEKRGIIFVGKSGVGKSNLICISFLQQRREKAFAIFVDARRLKDANIKEFFRSSVIERIEEQCDISDFDHYLESIQRKIILFIDAVNEYSSTEGPIGLLKNIIHFVEDINTFRNVRIIASCRLEVWNQYKEDIEREINVLDKNLFLTDFGDAITITGFEEEKEREILFNRYQKYYHLLPEKYEYQSQTFKDLIKYPFMMRIIAETYYNPIQELDNDDRELKKQIIPKNLNFFALFRLLTDRKISDAQRLLSKQDWNRKKGTFAKNFEDCLLGFADLLYQRLTETSESGNSHLNNSDIEYNGISIYDDRTDSLPEISLNNDNNFNKFMKDFSDETTISVFETIIQVGLIEKTSIVEYDFSGNKKEGIAYKFYHDQYTQYCLGAIYNEKIIKKISSEILKKDRRSTENTIDKIKSILDNSKYAPVLEGALDHWFYNNMSNGERSISDFLVILFNYLSTNESGSVKFYVSSFLYSLIEKNIIEPKKLFKTIFEQGNFQLKKCLVDYIPQLWPDMSSECFRSLIESCEDENDDTILRCIGDVFADLFLFEPQRVIKFMDVTLHGFDRKKLSLVKDGIFDRNNFIKHISFILKFSLKAVLTNFSDMEKMDILREFLRKKFRYIIDAALLSNNKRSYSIKSMLRSVIYRKLEYNGINQWDQTVASQGGNNTFFIEDNSLVQRDVLYEYYKYVIDFHNGHIELLPLDKESHFRKITVQMMNYRDGSIIGYVATVILAAVIKDNREILNDIIDELIACNSKSSRHFTSLLLIILSLMNKDKCDTILDIYLNKFLPHIVSSSDYIGYSVILNVASIDIDRYWEYVVKILDYICEILTNTHDTEKISILEDNLPFCCFLPEIKIGTNIIHYMIKEDFFDKPLWRTCVLKVLAGLLARSPKILNDLLIKEGIDISIVNEVRPLINEKMLEMKDIKSYHYSWNEFVVAGISSLITLHSL